VSDIWYRGDYTAVFGKHGSGFLNNAPGVDEMFQNIGKYYAVIPDRRKCGVVAVEVVANANINITFCYLQSVFVKFNTCDVAVLSFFSALPSAPVPHPKSKTLFAVVGIKARISRRGKS